MSRLTSAATKYCNDLDSVWIRFYKEVTPTALRIPFKTYAKIYLDSKK